jgi:hypothetical protein
MRISTLSLRSRDWLTGALEIFTADVSTILEVNGLNPNPREIECGYIAPFSSYCDSGDESASIKLVSVSFKVYATVALTCSGAAISQTIGG